MAAVVPIEDIRARVEEARDRVMTKVDEIRARFGGGGVLGKRGLGKTNILGTFGILNRRSAKAGAGVPLRRYTRMGPRVYVSNRGRTARPFFWGNSHTLAGKEITALGPGPLEKDRVAAVPVPAKVLDK